MVCVYRMKGEGDLRFDRGRADLDGGNFGHGEPTSLFGTHLGRRGRGSGWVARLRIRWVLIDPWFVPAGWNDRVNYYKSIDEYTRSRY